MNLRCHLCGPIGDLDDSGEDLTQEGERRLVEHIHSKEHKAMDRLAQELEAEIPST